MQELGECFNGMSMGSARTSKSRHMVLCLGSDEEKKYDSTTMTKWYSCPCTKGMIPKHYIHATSCLAASGELKTKLEDTSIRTDAPLSSGKARCYGKFHIPSDVHVPINHHAVITIPRSGDKYTEEQLLEAISSQEMWEKYLRYVPMHHDLIKLKEVVIKAATLHDKMYDALPVTDQVPQGGTSDQVSQGALQVADHALQAQHAQVKAGCKLADQHYIATARAFINFQDALFNANIANRHHKQAIKHDKMSEHSYQGSITCANAARDCTSQLK
jgi:hypothetical protein